MDRRIAIRASTSPPPRDALFGARSSHAAGQSGARADRRVLAFGSWHNVLSREGGIADLLLSVALLAVVVPLLATRYLPFTDLPEHVAVMATLSRWFDTTSGESSVYVVSFWRSQYLVYHGTGALLTRIVGDAVLANRLLLVGVAIALPLSVRAALRGFGRDETLAFLACMPFLSRPLFVGFLPYVSSLPLYFLGIALVLRPRSRRSVAVLALLSVVLVYTHLSAFAVFVATAVGLDVVIGARAAAHGDMRFWPFIGARVRSLVWLLPAALVALAWSLATRITLSGDSITEPREIGTMRLTRALHALPLWAFDIFRNHVDEIAGALWWSTLAVLAVLGARATSAARRESPVAAPSQRAPWWLRPLARLDPALVPLLCVLAVFLVTPFRVGAGGMLNVRLAPLVALTAILPIARSSGRLRTTALAAVAVATLVHGGNATFQIRAMAELHVAHLDEVLAAMRPGARLVTLPFDPRREHTSIDPYPFVGSYHRARGGGIASYSFSDLVHWPVQYRNAARPPAKAAPLWIYAPCAYRHAVDGPYYDYVLVSGGTGDLFAREPAGPAFRERLRVPGYVLYEKIPGETWEGDGLPDLGPCARRKAL
jgi:hypothetical protein